MKPKHIKHLKSILESILSSIAKMKELRKFEMFNRLLHFINYHISTNVYGDLWPSYVRTRMGSDNVQIPV